MILFALLLILILLAAGVAWYFISHDRGEKEPVSALWLAAGLGLAGGVVAAIIEGVVLNSKNLTPGAPLKAVFVSTMAVGIIEESCKYVPLALWLYPKRFFNEHTDGIIYFALAGMGFGLPENILYTLQFGASAGLARIILTPVFHAATTGIVGYFLIKGKLANKSRTWSWLVLAAAMLTHGLYDFGLISNVPVLALLSIVVTLSVSIGLFLLYDRATGEDQALGLSAVGHN
jgi:protease PrsW